MTRAISHFSGQNNELGSQTVYTVPAGRTAKVLINYVFTSSSGTNYLAVNGQAAVSGTNASVGSPVTSTASSSLTAIAVPGHNQSMGMINGVPTIFTTVWYIGTGNTVSSVSSGGGGGGAYISYDFTVIEEY
jgi:hypothetical protein